MKFLAFVIALLLAPIAAAQTLTFPPCPSPGSYSSVDGKTFVCNPAGTGSSQALTAGPGIYISPTGAISTSFPVKTLLAARPIAPSDGTTTLVYNSATPGTFPFPASGSAGFSNGWATCFYVRGLGSLTMTSASAFYGGSVTMAPGESQCVQADDTGSWLISGGARVVVNPNPFQR